MKLSRIFDKAPSIEIGELTTDSRVKTNNGMFFCLDGLNTNGHRFIPQAIKNILPTLGNEFIALIKETSVVSFVGVTDLYKAFNTIGTNSYEFMVPYIVMAIIYIILVLIISLLIRLMERSLKKSDRRN